jgi:hypothetical protein
MNKKIFLIIIICIIIVCVVFLYLKIDKQKNIIEEAQKTCEITKSDKTLATIQEKLCGIKSIHAEENVREYHSAGGEPYEAGQWVEKYDFVFPDKKQILVINSPYEESTEDIIIGKDIYKKLYLPPNQKSDLEKEWPSAWVHGEDGQAPLSLLVPDSDQEIYFYSILYPEGLDFTKKLEKIEEDLGIEELNGVRLHHYKVKVKKLLPEDAYNYFFGSILRSDAINFNEEDSILKQERDKIRYIGDDKEFLIPITHYELITSPFKVIQISEMGTCSHEELPLEGMQIETIQLGESKISDGEKCKNFESSGYYNIDAQGIEGEIWVGEEDFFVYKEKYTVENAYFFFDPNDTEEENKNSVIVYTKYIYEINYSNFDEEIEINPPKTNVMETTEYSEEYTEGIRRVYQWEEETNKQPTPTINMCVLSSPLLCDEYLITQSNGIKLVIKNRMGDSIQIDKISITNCGFNNNSGAGWTLEDEAVQNIILKCTPTLTSGNNFTGNIMVSYKKTGGKINLVTSGILTGKIST